MKRRLIQLMVFLLLGAIVNVAVAWGIGFATPHIYDTVDNARMYLDWIRGGHPDGVFGFLARSEMRLVVWTSAGRGSPDFGIPQRLPSWSMSYAREPLSGFVSGLQAKENVVAFEYAAGFPSLGLRYFEVTKNQNKASVLVSQHGLALHLPRLLNDWRVGADLPCTPIWPGFAINTLFCAVILWLLFAAPFALRRRFRIRRGLCPACAYPVGDSEVCTECGKSFVYTKHARILT